jgi:DNA-binding NarL/FixJ family response regulator
VKPTTQIRVLIANDEELVRDGLRRILSDEPDVTVVGDIPDAAELAVAVARLEPDVVLMGTNIIDDNESTTFEAARPARIVLMSALGTPSNGEAKADAFVSTRTSTGADLIEKIRSLVAGHVAGRGIRNENGNALDTLSRRERQVLKLVASGYTNQEAADRLGVSVKTVEGYRSRVMRKLDAPNRATLVRVALQTGLLAVSNLD